MGFFEVHDLGLLILVGLVVFPRITLLFMGTLVGMPWVVWIGWLVFPRSLIAILSLAYWNTDPGLVVCAFLVAVFGAARKRTEHDEYGRKTVTWYRTLE